MNEIQAEPWSDPTQTHAANFRGRLRVGGQSELIVGEFSFQGRVWFAWHSPSFPWCYNLANHVFQYHLGLMTDGKDDWVELPPQGLNVLHSCAGVSCAS